MDDHLQDLPRAKADKDGWMAEESERNLCYWYALMMMINNVDAWSKILA